MSKTEQVRVIKDGSSFKVVNSQSGFFTKYDFLEVATDEDLGDILQWISLHKFQKSGKRA